jgi:hypothetical protein
MKGEICWEYVNGCIQYMYIQRAVLWLILLTVQCNRTDMKFSSKDFFLLAAQLVPVKKYYYSIHKNFKEKRKKKKKYIYIYIMHKITMVL